MRKALKKIVALGVGATMLGATMLGATAADLNDYPGNFKSADGKSFNALLVVGDAAAAEDVAGVTSIALNLQFGMSETKVVPGTASSTTIEGAAKVETSGKKLYYGDNLDAVKNSVTDTDLPNLLATGTVTDEDGTSYDYTQTIRLPTTSVAFDKTIPDTTNPVLMIDWQTGQPQYQLDINFPTVLKLGGNITDEVITLFGRQYTFSGTPSDLTNSSITLFGGGVDQTFTAGDSASVAVGGETVDVEVLGVNTQTTTAQATVVINGESKQVVAGRTYTIGGIRTYVKDIFAYTVPAASGAVRLFIGTDKVVLGNGDNVKVGSGSTDVDGTNVVLTSTSNQLSSIKINVTPNLFDDIVDGQESGVALVDPVFGTFKLEFTGGTPALDSADREMVQIDPSSENKARLQFTNKNGQDYSLTFLVGSQNATDCIEPKVDSYDLIYNGLSINRNDYFVISQDGYSHILQLRKIDTNPTEIQVKDSASGGATNTWSYSSGTGSMQYDGKSYSFAVGSDHINVTSGTSTSVTTKGGATVALPTEASCLNSSGTRTHAGNNTVLAMTVSLTEETTYNDEGTPDDYGVVSAVVEYDYSATNNDMTVATPSYTATAGVSSWSGLDQMGDGDDYQAITPYGTVVDYNTDNDKLSLGYFGSETYYNVFIAPTDAVATTVGGAGGTYAAAVEIDPIAVVKLASEVTSPTGQNLILVGGPCANEAARVWMGATAANCADGFTAGEGIIKLIEKGNKVALLVAGMNAADTRAAATAVAGGKLASVADGVNEVVVTYTNSADLTTISVSEPTTTTTTEEVTTTTEAPTE